MGTIVVVVAVIVFVIIPVLKRIFEMGQGAVR